MAPEKTFEREVLDRMIVLETKMDVVISACPQCKEKVNSNEIILTKVVESAKSAHHRIDGVYKTAGLIALVVSGIMGAIEFVLSHGRGM